MNYKNKAERYRLTREIAQEGIVLLKNRDDVLPIGNETVAVFGRTQINTIKCGTGSAFCLSEYEVSVLEGIQNAGISVDEALKEKYVSWVKENPLQAFGVWGSGSHINPEMPITREEVKEVALRGVKKAIFVIGRTAGENDDVVVMDGDYMLSSEEKALLEAICRYFAEVIVVVNSGNLIDLSFTERSEIKAVLLLNLPGMEGGNALGDILSGKVSPSAKLTDTIARHYGDYPSADRFGAKTGLVQKYKEDIFVGYRYFETFPYMQNSVLYPFGYGLSYTSFEMKCTHFECDKKKDGKVRAVISVKNTGKREGKEVVMLYSSSPKSALGTPAVELRAFQKTSLLSPGETAYVSLTFPIHEMASFDDAGVLGTKDAWVMAAGEYGIYLGNNVETLEKIGVYENEALHIVKTCVHMETELSSRLTLDGSYEKLDCIPPDPNLGYLVMPDEPNRIQTKDYFSCDGDVEYLHAGEKVTYRLNVSAMGMYRTHFHIFHGMEAEADYEILINGLPMIEAEAHYQGAEIILPMGSTDITFIAKKDGKFAIRSITLEKNDEPTEIDGEGTSYMQGGKYVDAALWVFNKRFYDEDGVIKSGRELARMHTPGRYAMYHLNVKKAGYYDVRLRFENRHPQDLDLRDTFSFLVSNVTQDIEKVVLKSTGKGHYSTSEPIRLAFPKGEVYLSVVSVSHVTPRVAYFEFSPSTRKVVIEQHEKGAAADMPISEVESYDRRPLAEIKHEYDFRDVVAGKLPMNTFVESLSDEELALLSCGNSEGKIGYMPERGIPEARWADGPVGLRLNCETTVYPSGTMLAASFNTELARELGRAIGDEAQQYNIDVWLAPAINIHRNPCCGRNFEYNSEDPVVAGEIASAIINGVQEKDVAATVKHFAANNTEYQRMRSNSRVSARALREIYMKAFEIVIKKSNPYSIMTSYNHINGIKVCEDPTICRGVIRDDFGYLGVLMTDFSNDSIHVKELRAGHDLKMHFGDTRSVTRALEDGSLPRDTVQKSVKRILEMLVLTSIQNEKKQ